MNVHRRFTPASIVLLVLALALPAIGYTGNNYIVYDGTYCDWDGYHEHYDQYPNVQLSVGLGTTGIQSGYSGGCDRTRVKIRWEPVGQSATTDTVTRYASGASTNTLDGMEYLYWTDHDVHITGTSTWHGYRNSH